MKFLEEDGIKKMFEKPADSKKKRGRDGRYTHRS